MPYLNDRPQPPNKLQVLLEDCFSNLKQISAYTAENVREIIQLSFEQQENRAYFSGLREAYALFFNRLQAKDNGVLDRVDRAVGNFYTANDENRLAIQALVEINKEQTQQIALLLQIQEKKNSLNDANIALSKNTFSATVNSLDYSDIETDLESQAAAFDDDYGTDTIGDEDYLDID
ncbi:hypothetical protein LC612_31050 [Nostoc sp. CHAB 5834]|nr:hypothetical protein [Nostoc sp. CHAB 5834]